jgi:Fe-S-cluster containining protein
MRDGPIRTTFKLVALLRFAVDLGVTRLIRRLRGESVFVLRGACQYCGGCCETPMIQTGRLFFYLPTCRWLFLTWQRLVNQLELLNADRATSTFTFRCGHWDTETRRCDSYATRPGMCRDYPRLLLDSVNPKLLDSCGYRAVDRRAQRLRRIFAENGLSAQQQAELEQRLHLLD